MLSEIVHPVIRYLLIGALPFVGLIVVCLILVAFADADVHPIKLNRLDAEPDRADAVPEAHGDTAVGEEGATESALTGSANDQEELDQIFARPQARSR